MARNLKIFLIATAFGFLMASLIVVKPVYEWLASSRTFVAFYDTVHFPAELITLALVAVFRPRDDGFMLYAVGVIIQWIGIGGLIWIAAKLKSRRSHTQR
jgi:hypothetical protein